MDSEIEKLRWEIHTLYMQKIRWAKDSAERKELENRIDDLFIQLDLRHGLSPAHVFGLRGYD